MSSFQMDQAEGLRRLLGTVKPKVFAFLSTTPSTEKSVMLMNLAASLNKVGSNVLILDSVTSGSSVSSMLGVPQNRTLLDGVRLGKNIQDGVREMQQGFSLATMMREQYRNSLTDSDKTLLGGALLSLSKNSDVTLVDAELDANDMLQIPAMDDAHIVIQLSTSPDSIKGAYALIKRVGNQMGRRPFSLLFTNSSEDDGARVFENMSSAATRYLALRISSFGCIPDDEFIFRAVKLKRSVIEAFPKAKSSEAFHTIATKLREAVV